MDLITGQQIVITGATSGIGKATALELARCGGEVAIVCRNLEKGKVTAGEIETAVPGATVEVFLADLSELDQVRQVAQEISARYEALDVLIDNAGCRTCRPGVPRRASTTCSRPTTSGPSC